MRIGPLLRMAILVLLSLNACQPALVSEKEQSPSDQFLPTATGSVNLPVLVGEDTAPRPEIHIIFEAEDISALQGVVIAFQNDISEGAVDSALRFWKAVARDEWIQR